MKPFGIFQPFFYLLTLLFFLASPLSFCLEKQQERVVLVSVAPYVTIVKKLVGSSIEVALVVPQGASSHTYEPTPKQILKLSRASIWFGIQEPFEKKVYQAILHQNPQLKLINLRQGLSCSHSSKDLGSCSHHHEGSDPHIWMSPKMMQEQVKLIAKTLIDAFQEDAKNISSNEKALLEELEQLDLFIRKTLQNKHSDTIFVSHPVYGYFCEEYGLHQISIEFDGKDPTPKQLTTLLQKAKSDHVKVIFGQKEYSNKAAVLIAQELGAHVVILDPYSEKYFESLKQIAEEFAQALGSSQ